MITAADIIAGLKGNEHGMCHCPAHEDKTPSLHVSDGDGGKVLVRCHAGCSQEAVIEALKACDLWPTASKHSTRNHDKRRDQTQQEFESFCKAVSILRAAVKAQAGPPTAYLQGRKIKIIPPGAMILPAPETARLTGKRYPAMVILITNEQGLLQGAQLTWLCQDATAKLAVSDDRPRRMFGQTKGGFVRLASSEPNRPLIIGEGIETTLSAMQLTGLPGIAALSASNMMVINPPVASSYIVAADHDANGVGQHGARVLARRLARGGAQVRLALLSRPDLDWNDLLCSGEEPAQLRKALVEAPWFESVEGPGSVGMSEFKVLEFPPRRALMGRWLTTTGIAMIFGDPGTMKTRLALSVGYAVALARACWAGAASNPHALCLSMVKCLASCCRPG